jgi:hypothetical protein
MIKYFVAAISAIFLIAAIPPAKSDSPGIPAERIFPSAVGDVVFKHQMHIQDRAIQCAECHHQINARKLKTPHPDYFKSTYINCEICHNEPEKIKQRAYSCSGCHPANPVNIADETLSAKVVIHKQCWKCHAVGTGKEASAGCEKCHSGRKRS